jgi:hypothetical protein
MSRSRHESIRTIQWPVSLAALCCGIVLSPALPASGSQLTNVQTVFLVIMENVSWSAIKGSAAAPYINNTLLPLAAYCEQYYSSPGVASSLPDYLWLEGGTNFGITASPEPANARISNTNHFVTLLETAGISWKGYFEGISGTNCPLASGGLYAAYHNPFVYFDDVTSDAAFCRSRLRPYTELAADFTNHTVAHYNFIVPNLCNDMHNANDARCASFNRITTGDLWLATAIPRIMQSPAYADNGAILITWDESTLPPTQVPIGMIVISPLAKGGGYASTNRYTHASALRAMQEIFGVRPFLAGAAAAASLGDLFRDGPGFTNDLRLVTGAAPTNGQFQFALAGTTLGRTNVIRASTNLSNWVLLRTNVTTSNNLEFSDPAAANFIQRFYQMLELP